MQQLDFTVKQETHSTNTYERDYSICQHTYAILIRTSIISSVENWFDNQHTNHIQTISLELHDLIFS